VRGRHVPNDLILTEQDIRGVLQSIGSVMPVVCDAIGLSEARSLVLENLVRADYETYMLPALLRRSTPKGATITELVGAGHVGRTGVYESLDGLIEDLERCAIAIALLFEARGDFVKTTAWCLVDVSSPVGKAAKGPGIVGGRQHFYGLALVGGDMCLPACLRIPADGIDEKGLATEIAAMLKLAAEVALQLRDYARGGPVELVALGVDWQRLAAHRSSHTVLVPELHVGPARSERRWPTPLRPNAGALSEMLQSLPIDRLVVESVDDPLEEPEAWDRIAADKLEKMLAFVPPMGLNTAIRPSDVTYLLRHDGLKLYRYDHFRPTASTGGGISHGLSFDLAGFDTSVDKWRGLAEALAFVEFLTTNVNPPNCSARFGRLHAPARIKSPSGRPLLCAARMIENDLLVCEARVRQAAELLVV
jgi:hypothetical protein